MWIKQLSELNISDRKIAGGKAAQLGHIVQAGLSVPPGYVLTTKFFDEIIHSSGLHHFIASSLEHFQKAPANEAPAISGALQSAVLGIDIGAARERMVFESFDLLGVDSVAVRSSAPEEDGERYSWAGQFETKLGVRRGMLLRAIKECWASLFGVSALEYRRESQPAGGLLPSIAVIIQATVDSDFAGVSFSIDPVTGSSDVMLVECVQGLGEALVSGVLTPAQYRICKTSGVLRGKSEPKQAKSLLLDSGGGVRWNELTRPSRINLPSPLLAEIFAGVTLLESEFGCPLDVEWASRAGMVYFLQARPITAVGGESGSIAPTKSRPSKNTSETYEFYWGETRTLFSVESEFETYLHHRSLPANECRHALCVVEAGYATMYFCREDLPAARLEAESFLRDSSRFGDYLRQSERVRKDYQLLLQDRQRIGQATGQKQLREFWSRFLEVSDRVRALYKISQPAYTDIFAEALRELLIDSGAEEEELEPLVLTLGAPTALDIVQEEEIAAIEMSLAVKVLTPEIVRKHCERFPWLFLGTFDRGLAEEFVRQKIEALGETGIRERAERVSRLHAEQVRAAEAKEELFSRFQSANVRRNSEILAELTLDRLKLKSCWAGTELLFFDFFSEVALLSGLSVEECLNTYRRADIYRLLESGQRISEQAKMRREESYAFYLSDADYNFFEGQEARNLRDQFIPPQAPLSPGEEIRGTIAHLGFAAGVARIIRVEGLETLLKDLERFSPGEILVTTMTQPTMLTLASSAAAIVTNEGGVTSHASVIAREVGIPCVVGTKRATELINDGDFIEVDAFRGIVRKLARQPERLPPAF